MGAYYLTNVDVDIHLQPLTREGVEHEWDLLLVEGPMPLKATESSSGKYTESNIFYLT